MSIRVDPPGLAVQVDPVRLLYLPGKVELVSYRIHKKPICPEHFTDNVERKYFHSALKR